MKYFYPQSPCDSTQYTSRGQWMDPTMKPKLLQIYFPCSSSWYGFWNRFDVGWNSRRKSCRFQALPVTHSVIVEWLFMTTPLYDRAESKMFRYVNFAFIFFSWCWHLGPKFIFDPNFVLNKWFSTTTLLHRSNGEHQLTFSREENVN